MLVAFWWCFKVRRAFGTPKLCAQNSPGYERASSTLRCANGQVWLSPLTLARRVRPFAGCSSAEQQYTPAHSAALDTCACSAEQAAQPIVREPSDFHTIRWCSRVFRAFWVVPSRCVWRSGDQNSRLQIPELRDEDSSRTLRCVPGHSRHHPGLQFETVPGTSQPLLRTT